MKRVAKGILLFLASTTYVWLLFLTAGAMELRLTLTTPATLKTWLSDGGIYSGVVSETSKLATIQQAQENSVVQITSDDISEVAKSTFPVEGIQNDTERVIDGFYGWFKGDTTSPEFTVDFSSRQAQFAKEMTDKLEVKINALPECATTGRFSIQAFDPFKSDCRPKGVDLTAELTSFEKDLASSKDVLKQTAFSGNDVKLKNSSGQEEVVASALTWVPKAYKGLLYGPFLLAILTVIMALSLIFLSSSRRRGLKRFAGGLMFAGVVMVASGFLLRPAFDRLNSISNKSLGAQASFSQAIIDPLFKQMNKTYSRYNIIFGTVFIIPALITYSALLLTRHKREEDDDEVQEEQYIEHIEENERDAVEPNDHVAANNQPEHQVAQTVPSAPTPLPAPTGVPPVARPTQRPITRRPPMIQG